MDCEAVGMVGTFISYCRQILAFTYEQILYGISVAPLIFWMAGFIFLLVVIVTIVKWLLYPSGK